MKNFQVSKVLVVAAEKIPLIKYFYNIDTSVLLENITLVKFMKTTSGT